MPVSWMLVVVMVEVEEEAWVWRWDEVLASSWQSGPSPATGTRLPVNGWGNRGMGWGLGVLERAPGVVTGRGVEVGVGLGRRHAALWEKHRLRTLRPGGDGMGKRYEPD